MNTKKKAKKAAVLISASIAAANVNAQSPLDKALEVPGAKPNIPVSQVKKGFNYQFIADARSSFDNFHMQMGGDHALYYATNMSEFMPSALAKPHGEVSVLKRNIDSSLNNITFVKGDGEVSPTLVDYIHDEKTRVQGVIILKGGEVVYEAYPG